MKRRAVVFATGAVAAVSAAAVMRPRHRASETLPAIQLDAQVPAKFGDWSIDSAVVPVLPNPELQSKLNAIYTQVLARTYVKSKTQRVMLSIAYGADQGSDATSVHRPEFCYSAQGFSIRALGSREIVVDGRHIDVRRLVGTFGSRVEPIAYWVTLNDTTVLPGLERKLGQIRLGLSGQIPDGMLVRVSSIGPDPDANFALQLEFLNALASSMAPGIRDRYFGRPST